MDCSCFSFSHTASSSLVTKWTPHLPQRQLRLVEQRGGRGASSPESLTFPELSFLFSALMKPEAMFPHTPLLLQPKVCLSVSRLWTTSPSSCTSWPWRHSCCVWGLQEWRSTRVRKLRRPWRSSRLRRGGWPSRPRNLSTTWRKTEQRREAAVHRYCTAPLHKTCGKYFKQSTYLVLWNSLSSSRKMSCVSWAGWRHISVFVLKYCTQYWLLVYSIWVQHPEHHRVASVTTQQ